MREARPQLRWLSWVLWCAGTALAYYAGARLGLSLALVRHQVTPLWPPTGIALAALFVSRGRAWPGWRSGRSR